MTMSPDEIRDAQRAAWDKFSPGWEKWDGTVLSMLGPIGAVMIEACQVRPDSVHLDVAAGTGEPGLTIAAIATQGRVVVTDLAPGMLEVARKNAAARGLANVEFRECDAGQLPFDDASFDSVTCRMGFMFFPDVEAAAREIARVLKPGGRVSAAVWAEPAGNPWVTIPLGAINAELSPPAPPPGAPGMFRCAEPGYVRALFDKAGLHDIVDRDVAGELDAAGGEQVWAMMTEVAAPIAGPLAGADDAARERIRASVLEQIEQFRRGDRITIPTAARVTSATK